MASRTQTIEYLQALARAERESERQRFEQLESEMKDDPKKTGRDSKLISLEEPHEVRSWMESLGVTEQQLRAAVAAVGHSAEKVREYLRKK